MMSIRRRTVLVAATLAASLGSLAVLGAIARGPSGASLSIQPARPMSPQPAGNELNTVYMPPGKYTAIVLTSNAQDRRWIVSLKTNTGSYPITIGPTLTVTIPFEGGWTVQPDMNARIESKLVPFEDLSERNLLDGNETLGISAWGITDRGPVNFAPPKKK